MKKLIAIALLIGVFFVVFPAAVSMSDVPRDAPSEIISEEPHAPDGEKETPIEEKSDSIDDHITVNALIGGEVTPLSMSDYIIGVTAAEMPASFETEALKAQAIAARTYTLYKMRSVPSGNHPDADVCDDINCCKAYTSDENLREKWGASYAANIAKIEEAVRSTDGVCMVYDGEPILAVFHSSSPGLTESSAEVWGRELPYLVSVISREDGGEIQNYVSSVTVSSDDFIDTMTSYDDAAFFGDDSSEWVSGVIKTDSGRMRSAVIGGVSLSGTELRRLFGLRSAAISIDVGDDNVVFTTVGYGHGVGMSQYGANEMAKEGNSYEDILEWYYTGIGFGIDTDFLQ